MESKLYTFDEVSEFINQGKILALAGIESLLSELPKGNWIGGTIPYFMGKNTSLFSKDLIFVNDLSDNEKNFSIKSYDVSNIQNIVGDTYANGYTIVIFPPFTEVHKEYAVQIPHNKHLFDNPITGWVAGIDLDSNSIAKTYNGLTGQRYIDAAVAMHIELPEEKIAWLDIVNIFEQSDEEVEIKFLQEGFSCETCLVNGVETNFAHYLKEREIDTKLPLISDYSGALINVSIQSIARDKVYFYAPVFADKTYKFAKPIPDYVKCFNDEITSHTITPEFACNCILNYLYGEMEGKYIDNISGPITFGEIGYQLLNQTLVLMYIE